MKVNAMLAMLLAGMIALQAGHALADQAPGEAAKVQMLIEVPSPLGFEETLERLEANAKDQGWKVPEKWKVDFQRNFMKVTDTDIGPNRVIKMCEPFAAAKLLLKDEYKKLTAMMPCTIAVYQKNDGKVYVAMFDLKVMGEMFGGDVREMAKELAPQMDAMLKFD